MRLNCPASVAPALSAWPSSNGLTAIPFENLEQRPDARLDALYKNRAEMCRFILDRLDATRSYAAA